MLWTDGGGGEYACLCMLLIRMMNFMINVTTQFAPSFFFVIICGILMGRKEAARRLITVILGIQ